VADADYPAEPTPEPLGDDRAMRDVLLPLQLVRVSGPSMVPTLRHGDRLLVWRGARVRPGDVVLARFPTLADVLVVKRAVREVDGGWWVSSDNAAAGSDSTSHGPADVLGRAVVLLRGGRRPARVPGRGL
jgi:phage repressor protein C with HTH and peptisase S24 domain